MIKKGILLAGGRGSRLYPITFNISKQLLPIYDKPMIYYPLATLMLADIREIMVITSPNDLEQYKLLLGDGSQWGISISYGVQPEPKGIADAFLIGEKFVDEEPCALILGDNIFYGDSLGGILGKAVRHTSGATIFSYRVSDPERYGVVDFDRDHRVISLEEKPQNPKSNFAVVGLYFYDEKATAFAKSLIPSRRGELEITDLNKLYWNIGELKVEVFGRGYAWLDTGTYDSLIAASSFIETVQKRQGLMIACLEEIAWNKGWINEHTLNKSIDRMKNTPYAEYLSCLLKSIDG